MCARARVSVVGGWGGGVCGSCLDSPRVDEQRESGRSHKSSQSWLYFDNNNKVLLTRSLTLSLSPSFSLSSCLALQRLFDRWKELVFFQCSLMHKGKRVEEKKKSLKMGFLCPMCKFIREVSGDGRSWGFSFVISLFFDLKGGTAMSAVLDPLVHIPAVKCKRCSSS